MRQSENQLQAWGQGHLPEPHPWEHAQDAAIEARQAQATHLLSERHVLMPRRLLCFADERLAVASVRILHRVASVRVVLYHVVFYPLIVVP